MTVLLVAGARIQPTQVISKICVGLDATGIVVVFEALGRNAGRLEAIPALADQAAAASQRGERQAKEEGAHPVW